VNLPQITIVQSKLFPQDTPMSRLKSVLPAKCTLAGAIAALLTAAGPGPAAAEPQAFRSVYTSVAAKDCRKRSVLKVEDTDYASDHLCPGIAGLVVLRQEEDLRETISVGRNRAAAEKEPAASEGFGAFNSTADTIEWRLDGKGKPFAIIQRWFVADGDAPVKNGRPQTKQILIVTRLPPGPVCQVAQIEVKGNPNANEAARKAADETARDYTCKDKASASEAR
jgi:hypothetical protein